MANTYNRINELLPPTHQLDGTYLDIIIKLGFSKTVQKHAALDRLEARLLQLDKKRAKPLCASGKEPGLPPYFKRRSLRASVNLTANAIRNDATCW